ncbi:fumarylacetoacetate hydrolase family protein [Pseudoxanthobacter sp.]|uniref:fumarylacetoacetate hydrolase family protein n=1 Tax=Pseudoxanthobacter sp. TaxID=1925742 RepID=UPI002FE12752
MAVTHASSEDFVIPAPAVPALAVEGGGRFPVRRIYCVGRNYAAHAREMGSDPDREPPFFFAKPADAVLPGGSLPYPPHTGAYHYEVELVVALRSGGRDIPVSGALSHVYGYAVGLDMTRRDLQNAAKNTGRPWDLAKGSDFSAPCGLIRPAAKFGLPQAGGIRLAVNGAVRQKGDLADMIWSVAETIAYLSGFVALAAGDLIFTGTPDGVGPVVPGDTMLAHIDGLDDLSVTVI